jgi:hypothetical protein
LVTLSEIHRMPLLGESRVKIILVVSNQVKLI